MSEFDQVIDDIATEWQIPRNRLLGISPTRLTPGQEQQAPGRVAPIPLHERDLENYYNWHTNRHIEIECRLAWLEAEIDFLVENEGR